MVKIKHQVRSCPSKFKCKIEGCEKKDQDDDDEGGEYQNFNILLKFVTKITFRTVEVHLFCDASEVAYSVSVYLRIIDDQGDVHCNFVMGNTTNPRLSDQLFVDLSC